MFLNIQHKSLYIPYKCRGESTYIKNSIFYSIQKCNLPRVFAVSATCVFLALSYILTYKQNDSFSLIEMWRIHFFSHSSLPYLNGCVVVTMPPFWNWIGKRRHLCPVLLTSAHNSTKGSFQIYSFVSKIFENVYSVLDLDISTVQFCVT